MRSTKICFVAPKVFPLLADDKTTQVVGGAELQQIIIATGLEHRGYSVSMICLNFGQEDQITINGIKIYRAHRPTEGVPVLRFIWPRLTSIWRCLKDADADIYYYSTAGMLAGVVVAFCRRYNKRSIFAAAANPDMERNTTKIRFARDRRIYEYGLRNADQILVQNVEQARLCRENYGRDPICIPNVYVPNVYVPNVYQPTTSGSASVGRNVLWVSTIRSIKRPEQFLDVARALPAFRFQMVGGPDTTEAALFMSIKTRAEQLENVGFKGYVPYSEIGRYFDEAAIFVNTSESEGFPNTFLQSWARGVPTVSFVDSGARSNGKPLGRIVDATNEMIATIAELMEDDVERVMLGKLCRAYVEETHSPERIFALYEDVFDGLLQKNRAGVCQPGENENESSEA